MKIAIVIKGTEGIISKDLDGKPILPGRIEYDYSNNLQGVNTTYSLIKRFKFKTLDDIKEQVNKLKFDIKDSFKVACSREGSHNFKSITVEKEIGEILFNKGFKVDLHNPKTVIFVDISDSTCLLGYLEKFDLCKRPYRFKINHHSINPLLAYSLVRFSGITKEDSLLDPFCKDSVIPIESYLYGIKNIHAFDILKNNIYNSDINIKLAKASIDLKHYEISSLSSLIRNIDYIITNPPYPSRAMQTTELKPLLKEFFIQSKKILNKSLVLVTPRPSLILELSKDLFRIEDKFTATIGSNNYTILKLSPC